VLPRRPHEAGGKRLAAVAQHSLAKRRKAGAKEEEEEEEEEDEEGARRRQGRKDKGSEGDGLGPRGGPRLSTEARATDTREKTRGTNVGEGGGPGDDGADSFAGEFKMVAFREEEEKIEPIRTIRDYEAAMQSFDQKHELYRRLHARLQENSEFFERLSQRLRAAATREEKEELKRKVRFYTAQRKELADKMRNFYILLHAELRTLRAAIDEFVSSFSRTTGA
jgi:hypothetical protein